MTFVIHKGTHRARPLYWLRWWALLINPKKISRKVMFFFDSKYELPDGDQEDHNKLFGVAFGGVHRNSARYGWRYSLDKKKFILSAYVYAGGNRIMEDLCECVANHWYQCDLLIVDTSMGKYYQFLVYSESGHTLNPDSYVIRKRGQSLFGFLLGSYFGGNRPAPNRISIDLKK